MKQLPYVAVAAIYLGTGVAGVPLALLPCAIAAIVVVAAAYAIENRGPVTAPIAFGFAFASVVAVTFAQRWEAEIVLAALAALALATASALTLQRPGAWPVLALAGAVLGTLLFLFG